jgi:hypothetical protein
MTHYLLIANLYTGQHVLDKGDKEMGQMGYHPGPLTCTLPAVENVEIKQTKSPSVPKCPGFSFSVR